MPPRTTDADWPESHDAVRFLVRSSPDARGRQHFYALWWSADRRRAQAFHGDLSEQVRRARRECGCVEIVERFGSLKAVA